MASTNKASGSQTPTIPDWLQPFLEPTIGGASQQILQMQQQNPWSYWAQFTPRPISPLSDYTQLGQAWAPSLLVTDPGILGSYAATATLPEITARTVETPPAEFAQGSLLANLVGGPIGSSPATIAGMRNWEQQVKPTVENYYTTIGAGRSGGLGEALGKSATQAYVPLVQQEIANRVTAVNQLREIANAETQRYLKPRDDTVQALKYAADQMSNLAKINFDQRVAAIQQQYQAGKLSEDQLQKTYDALVDERARLEQMARDAVFQPFGQTQTILGRNTESKGSGLSLLTGTLG